jgi:hypothetical protein
MLRGLVRYCTSLARSRVNSAALSGTATADVCRKHGISSATFYKWKAKYGGLCSRRIPMICSSVKRFGFMVHPPSEVTDSTHSWSNWRGSGHERLGSFHNQVELMQIDTIASPERPGLLNLGILPQAAE